MEEQGIYIRQEELNLNTNQSVTVVGCGGIGFWVCKFLAMSGIKKINAYDPDTIELHNLNRIDMPKSFIGKNKADLVKIVIETLRPECHVRSFPFPFSEFSTLEDDWLVDCTDKVDAQSENQSIAKKKGVNYFKAGYDGENFGINNKVAEWGESTNGYTTVPSWVVPASLIAGMAVAKILRYPKAEMTSNIKGVFSSRRIE